MTTIVMVLFIILTTITTVEAQPSSNFSMQDGSTVFLDVVCLRGNTDTAQRVDVYILVPYQALEFMRSNTLYKGQYQGIITVRDSLGKQIQQEKFDREIIEKNYENARGANGGFDYTQTILPLKPGKYTVEVLVLDNNGAKKEYRKTRVITVLNFQNFTFSMSGLLLVNSIEESGGRYTITPHLSDNVARLQDGFFVFFETYSELGVDSADFVYEISGGKESSVLLKSPRIRKSIRNLTEQQFIKIPAATNLASGTYNLRIIALRTTAPANFSKQDYSAVSERSISIERTISGFVLKDLEKSIRQMRYVASQTELDNIRDASSSEDKRQRFEEFWKKLDPTPITERNEAFEEYYGRIEFANKNYRSYTEGWLTDMGMVFIILGPPSNIERQPRGADGRTYTRWTYNNNGQYTFVDNSGFDDFRLVTLFPSNEKYKYSGNQ
ncbi:MAG: GWxTD domain-containing protein [Ignavibacteriae bacterium]|nr:GWxTD domain-containing protein [Ignavibacteriota bacterium]